MMYRPFVTALCLSLTAPTIASAQLLSAPSNAISSVASPTLMVRGDLDGDGDQDLVTYALHGRRLVWLENLDVAGPGTGDGTSWDVAVLREDVAGAGAVHLADIDGDGDLDVVFSDETEQTVSWLSNDGGAASFTEIAVELQLGAVLGIASDDIDADGDLDLLLVSRATNDVYWYENDDIGGPGTGTGATFTQHTIDASLSSATAVLSADLDGDGDLDVVAAATFSNDLVWYDNVDVAGAGSGDGSSWTKTIIDANFSGVSSVEAADIDGDGDLDIIAAARFADQVRVYANSAGDASSWTSTTVSSGIDHADFVLAGDVDGDGDLDIAAVGERDQEIVWFQNGDVSGPGTGDGTSWTDVNVTTTYDGGASLVLFDVDLDGDLDFMSTNTLGQEVTKFLNDDLTGPGTGVGATFTESPAVTGFALPWNVTSADMDGDGDMDLVFGALYGPSANWLENVDVSGPGTGDGATFTHHVVDPDFTEAIAIWPGDIDGDGDLDLSAGSTGAADHVWFENVDTAGPGTGDGTTWVKTSIPTADRDTIDLRPADIDGDGDLDLVGTRSQNDAVFWYENQDVAGPGTGDGSSWSTENIISTTSEPFHVHTIDFDGDGDLDVLGTSLNGDTVTWYENDDVAGPGTGDGSAWTANPVGTGNGPVQAFPADLDGDGDLDVVSAMNDDAEIVWYSNDDVAGPGTGDGTTFTKTVIGANMPAAIELEVHDIDGDGDLDVLATSISNGETNWYENTLGDASAWATTLLSADLAYPMGIEAVDLDGDGDPELAVAQYFGGAVSVFTNLNEPPVADAGGPYAGDEPYTAILDASASTDDGAILLWEWDCDGDGAYEITAAGPTGDTCSFADDGSYTIGLRLTDDSSTVSEATASVTVANVAPTLDTTAGPDATENYAWSYVPNATDPAGAADPLLWYTHGAPAAMTVNASTGELAWTPLWDDVGSHTFTLTVDDGDGGQAVETITIAVVHQDDDNDGLPDTWETSVGLDPTLDDAALDGDADGISNLDEWLGGTDPVSYDGPSVPTATAPIDEAEVPTAAPRFEWTAATDPQNDVLTYEVEVYADDAMGALLTSAAGIPETTWPSDVDLPENALAYWRVRAADRFVSGGWTELEAVWINAVEEAPSVPNPASPLTGQTVESLTPPFSWTASTDPEGAAVTYEVEVWRGDDLVLTGATSELEWTPEEPLLEDTSYSWTVRAGDDRDTWSEWAEEQDFTVDTANNEPSDIAWVSPADGAEVDTLSPYLEATESTDPEGLELTYVFVIDTAESFDSEDLQTVEQSTPVWDLERAGVELTNGTWHLRVRAVDPGGAASAWAVITIEVPYSAGCNCSVGAPTPRGGAGLLLLLAVVGLRRRR